MIAAKCLECPNSDICYEHLQEKLEEEYLDEIYRDLPFWELKERGEENVDDLLFDLHAYL